MKHCVFNAYGNFSSQNTYFILFRFTTLQLAVSPRSAKSRKCADIRFPCAYCTYTTVTETNPKQNKAYSSPEKEVQPSAWHPIPLSTFISYIQYCIFLGPLIVKDMYWITIMLPWYCSSKCNILWLPSTELIISSPRFIRNPCMIYIYQVHNYIYI